MRYIRSDGLLKGGLNFIRPNAEVAGVKLVAFGRVFTLLIKKEDRSFAFENVEAKRERRSLFAN